MYIIGELGGGGGAYGGRVFVRGGGGGGVENGDFLLQSAREKNGSTLSNELMCKHGTRKWIVVIVKKKS